jgi:hypothetical protein
MTPFRSAIDALADLSVPGVTTRFGITAVPEEISRGQLPALLILPLDVSDDDTTDLNSQHASGSGRSGAFQAIAFLNTARDVTYVVDHLLLVAPLAAGSGLRDHLPRLVDLIDAYFTALGADLTLGVALAEAARVRVLPGIVTYGGVIYAACTFQHTWRVQY